MPGRIAVVLVLVLGVLPLPAGESAAQWRGDVEALAAELKRVHPRFRTCGLPPELETAKAALLARLDTLTDPQIVVEMQRLLAAVGDGHTLLWPFGMKQGALLRIPVMLWHFDDGLYLIDAPETRLIGRKVMRIGSLAADDALRAIEPWVSRDNAQQARWAAPFYLTFPDFLVALGAVRSRDAATVTLENGEQLTLAAGVVDPERLETKLIAPKSGKAPDYLTRRDEPFHAEEIRPGILYVGVNAMGDRPGKTLEAFGKELRSLLAPYPRAVVDLRLNNGGEAAKADELLKTLIAFDTRGGHIAVLIGRMTFSAAQTFATRVNRWTDAIFVGEPTGSRPNHYGNEHPFKLPFSGIRGTISSGYNQPVSARDERSAIEPDVTVPFRAVDYFSGRDPVLEAALEALAQDRPKRR